jgi:hypothetical protein
MCSGNRTEQRPSLFKQLTPAHFEKVSEFAIGIGPSGKRYITVASQRPVRLEEMGFRVVGGKHVPLLEQYFADLVIDVPVGW